MSEQSPRYHFHPVANWMNDPNGLIQWQGEYHLFYQYNPAGPFHGTIHWGHALSKDLVHWSHLPIALTPTPGGPDALGCFSGCAINNDGTPTFMYTGISENGDNPPRETQCLASSSDNLLTWQKHPANPVIAAPPPDLDVVGFRDPFVWREGEGWACIVGSGIRGVGGTVLLYRSPDAVHWSYVGPLWMRESTLAEPVWTGSMWECPQLFPYGDRHVQIMSVWNEGKTHYTVYAIGSYTGDTFIPETIGRFDLGPDYYAPAVMRDDQGRWLIWGWLREARKRAAQQAAGWSGVMSLPRVLSLDHERRLCVEPVAELEALRQESWQLDSCDIADTNPYPLPVSRGDGVELLLEYDLAQSTATAWGLLVRCSPDREEYTEIRYDAVTCSLTVDREQASLDDHSYRGAHTGQLRARSTQRLTLRIFLDRSVIEVYVDKEACLTERIYPTRSDSQGLFLFAQGGSVRLNQLTLWTLADTLAEQ